MVRQTLTQAWALRPASDPEPNNVGDEDGLVGNFGDLRAPEDIEADVIRLAIGHYRGRMIEVARRLGIER